MQWCIGLRGRRRPTTRRPGTQRLVPDMDGCQIEDIPEVDPGRPRRRMAAAPCGSIATDLLIGEARACVRDRSVPLLTTSLQQLQPRRQRRSICLLDTQRGWRVVAENFPVRFYSVKHYRLQVPLYDERIPTTIPSVTITLIIANL